MNVVSTASKGRGMTARDVMNEPVLTIHDDCTVEEVASFLIENAISGVPVVDRNRKLVGVVTLTDIAEQATREGRPVQAASRFYAEGWDDTMNREELRDLRLLERGRLARDIMMPTVFTIPDDTPVAEIAQTMIAGRIHRLLVTHDSHVVGIVTTLDLLKLLCKGISSKKG